MALTTYTQPAAGAYPFKNGSSVIGVPDFTGVYTAGLLGDPGISQLPSTPTEAKLGEIRNGWSADATLVGYGQFIFLAIPTSTTVTPGLLYSWDGGYNIVVVPTTVASDVLSGFPIAVAINSVASNATSIQYTWFQVQGLCYVLKAATLTYQPKIPLFVSSATAGRVQSTASAYRSIIGIRAGNLATVATACSVCPAYVEYPAIGPGK